MLSDVEFSEPWCTGIDTLLGHVKECVSSISDCIKFAVSDLHIFLLMVVSLM